MDGIPTIEDAPTIPTLTSEHEAWENEVYSADPTGGAPHPY